MRVAIILTVANPRKAGYLPGPARTMTKKLPRTVVSGINSKAWPRGLANPVLPNK